MLQPQDQNTKIPKDQITAKSSTEYPLDFQKSWETTKVLVIEEQVRFWWSTRRKEIQRFGAHNRGAFSMITGWGSESTKI